MRNAHGMGHRAKTQHRRRANQHVAQPKCLGRRLVGSWNIQTTRAVQRAARVFRGGRGGVTSAAPAAPRGDRDRERERDLDREGSRSGVKGGLRRCSLLVFSSRRMEEYSCKRAWIKQASTSSRSMRTKLPS